MYFFTAEREKILRVIFINDRKRMAKYEAMPVI